MNTRNYERLTVCEHCRCGIEAHEGYQPYLTIWVDDPDDETESKCDWCEDTGFDTLYEFC